MCDPNRTYGGDEKRKFFGLASKLVATVCQLFCIKTAAIVFWFVPQNQYRRFGDLDLTITTMVSWFEPQNEVGGSLSVCVSKPMSG
jgi:hypothetical protein